jgi:predicted transcriptional regulator of viral defense system
MVDKSATLDQRIAWVARRQHGVVAHRQLVETGLSRDAIATRVRVGRLHRLHRGVYAVGHRAPSVEKAWMAAVLACGAGAVLSHWSAARLWGMLPASGQTGRPIDVSLPSKSGRKPRKGIRIHRCASLTPALTAKRSEIPVTNPARTIADMQPLASPADMRRMVRQAEVQGLRTGLEPRRKKTRSELEDIFLALCQKHRLPTPEVNVKAAGREVDFVWPDLRFAVETDSYGFHRGQYAYEDDHDRDLALRLAGLDVARLTYRQLTTKPDYCMGIVEKELREAAEATAAARAQAPAARRRARRDDRARAAQRRGTSEG